MLDQFPESSWSVLDDVDLRALFQERFKTLQSTSEEGFDRHAARHWKQDAMQPTPERVDGRTIVEVVQFVAFSCCCIGWTSPG